MGFVKDFLVTTGIMAVGLELLGRKIDRDRDELYKTYADAMGVSVKKAKRMLEEAEREQALMRERDVAEKAERKAQERAERDRLRDLEARKKVWDQFPASGTHQ